MLVHGDTKGIYVSPQDLFQQVENVLNQGITTGSFPIRTQI